MCTACESKRKQRRQKKDEKKTEKEQSKRLMRKAEEVVNLITDGRDSLNELKSNGWKIKLSDMDLKCHLLP